MKIAKIGLEVIALIWLLAMLAIVAAAGVTALWHGQVIYALMMFSLLGMMIVTLRGSRNDDQS